MGVCVSVCVCVSLSHSVQLAAINYTPHHSTPPSKRTHTNNKHTNNKHTYCTSTASRTGGSLCVCVSVYAYVCVSLSLSFRSPRDYKFIDLVWAKCYDWVNMLRLGEYVKYRTFQTKKSISMGWLRLVGLL